jgi:hypothetical protein
MIKQRIIHNPSGYHSSGVTHKDKVNNFARFIKDFGWTGQWKEDPDSDILTLTAARGDNERIDIEWPAPQWWPDVWYTFAGNTIKCRNISHAAKLAQELPDAEAMRRATARRRAASRPKGAEGLLRGASGEGSPELNGAVAAELVTSLPFDKESTAKEVAAALKKHRNPTIIWVNRISGKINSAMMRTGKRHNKVSTNKEGKVIIQFTDETGFHAVYVESIVGLS